MPAAQMGVAEPDFFLICVGADLDLIMNAERFARIDLNRARFDYKLNHYLGCFYGQLLEQLSVVSLSSPTVFCSVIHCYCYSYGK